jgi:hypothetical protein
VTIERISLLVTVKAYPALSAKYGETVCVAGVRTDTDRPEWVRLFPVAFRDLPFAQRFRKYQHITVEAAKHAGDTRPETRRPNVDTLKLGAVVETKGTWVGRRPFVEPLLVESMCEVAARQKVDCTSLGAFRPAEVIGFEIDDDEDDWTASQAGVAAQPSLFFPGKHGLEKIPHRFRYHYRCGPHCSGHRQSMIDWELAQSYRRWRDGYDEHVLLQMIRQKFLNEMCDPRKDTIFFVGNHHRFPESFMMLGVFWPPKPVA